MARIAIKGIPHDAGTEPERPLRSMLREQLGLTGAESEVRRAGTASEGL
jgi:aerobic-type carbon monoxide dehydrogenase small subunit (CoxS/CutS family)